MSVYGLSVLFVVFGAMLAAFNAFLFVLTPRLLDWLGRVKPTQRAHSTLLVRSFPVFAAFLLSVLVFAPAWLRQEPSNTGETVSLGMAILAALALLPIAHGMVRATSMFRRTRTRLRTWRRRGYSAARAGTPYEVFEVRSADLALCVGGYLKPTIYASAEVMRTLDPAELEAALAHETKHGETRDPVRLLWMASCPDFLRLLRLDEPWRRAFARACEFAADAGASHGKPEVAIDLASALLKVARLRTFSLKREDAFAEVAVSSAFSSEADLEERVRALAEPLADTPGTNWTLRPWMFVVTSVALLGFGIVASEQVHELTEAVATFLAAR
ncbi:MAG: M56 family metallopeptidase [Vicinamibacteria bacterium]